MLWPSEHDALALCSSPVGFACALGRAFLRLVLAAGEPLVLGRTVRDKVIFTAGGYNYILLIPMREESISMTLNTLKEFTSGRLYLQICTMAPLFPQFSLV